MKARVVNIFSIIMMAVFLYGITPVEFLHDLFSTHQDTVDIYHPKGSADSISNPHTHCDFLSIAYCQFLYTGRYYIAFVQHSYVTTWFIPVDNAYYLFSHHIYNTRGPPFPLSSRRSSSC